MLDVKRYRSVIACIGLSIILVLSLFNSALNILTLLITCLIVLTWDVEDSICILMFIISFERVFKLQLGGFALLNVVEVVFVIRLLYARNFKLPMKAGMPLICFCIYSLAVSAKTSIIDCVSIIVALLMALLIMKRKEENYDITRIVEYTAAGLVVTSVIALFNGFFPRLESVLGSSRIRIGKGLYYYRFSGLQANPNYYTVLISVVLAVFAVMYLNKKIKPIDIAYAISLLVFGLMSSSLSFVVSILVLGLLFFVASCKKNIKYLFFGFLALSVVAAVIYSLRNTDFVSTVLYRLQQYSDDEELTAATLTTGRTDIWMSYIDYLLSHGRDLFLGVGVGANTYAIIGREVHNYFIEIVFYVGLIGAFLYSWTMVKIFGPKQYCVKETNRVMYIPFVIFFVRCFARCLFADELLVFMFFLCTVTVTYFANHDESERSIKE